MGRIYHFERRFDRFGGKQTRASVYARIAAISGPIARTDRRISVTASIWDADGYLLGAPDGTIDLHDGSLRQADSGDMITKLTAVGPAETTDCLRWFAFLQEATGNDPELIAFLQRLCGYCLTGDTREQVLAFVYGPGGNGKSVFVNTIAGILNYYATTAAMETFATARYDPQGRSYGPPFSIVSRFPICKFIWPSHP